MEVLLQSSRRWMEFRVEGSSPLDLLGLVRSRCSGVVQAEPLNLFESRRKNLEGTRPEHDRHARFLSVAQTGADIFPE